MYLLSQLSATEFMMMKRKTTRELPLENQTARNSHEINIKQPKNQPTSTNTKDPPLQIKF